VLQFEEMGLVLGKWADAADKEVNLQKVAGEWEIFGGLNM
jgi:hypothetical protein